LNCGIKFRHIHLIIYSYNHKFKLPSQRNIQQLSDLKDKLARSKAIVFADYAGLSVGQQTQLRSRVSEAGGEFTVAKNTLLKLALEQIARSSKPVAGGTSHEPRATSYLTGPTAVLFSYQDEVRPLKVMVEFAKGAEKPTVKGGFLGSRELTAEQVLELAKLPGKNELLVQLLGRLQSPIYGLENVLKGNLRKLVYVMNAIREKK
jgi:large subunit ribosomal protein L10